MRLWHEHPADRPQPFAARRARLTAACAILFLLLCAPCALCAEEPRIVSGFVCEAFPPPDVPQTEAVGDEYFSGVVLVGDSMAESFDLYGVVPELTVLSEIGASARTAHDYAIFSQGGRAWKLCDLLAQTRPEAVYLWLGSNGVDTKPASQVVADYEKLLDQLLAALPDTLVCCMALPPVHALAREQYANYTNERVDAFNEGLRALCARRNVYFLDITDLLRHGSGELDVQYAAGDGIHLKRPAYDLLAQYLYTHTVPR